MSDTNDWRRDRKSRKPGGGRDPFEEGEWSAPSPSPYGGAPSPRRDAGASGTETGAVVKRFDPARGFGFVTLEGGGGDAFLHISALQRAGVDAVTPGTRLRVRAGGGERGPQVTEVLRWARRAKPRRVLDHRARRSGMRHRSVRARKSGVR
ncbi:cold-shock protein [Roseomonas sp. CCTCC AB2023176]|uniref:cold-shock protein n=1 Tax=Roseomonas sp. CCTCC AB2023176 TaxID=3342640 RepID=UPI0035DA1D21